MASKCALSLLGVSAVNSMRMRTKAGFSSIAFIALASLIGASGDRIPPLVEAAKDAEWEEVRSLVDGGADVNVREADGTTALHWASYWDRVDIADLLIDEGAEVNVANDLGATPLWPASLNASEEMVRRLLAAGADPNLGLLSGETPLMTASRSGGREVVLELLAKGADPNASATRGQTALMWAVSQGHADVVEVLIENGAGIHGRSDVWKQLWQTDGGEVVHPDLHVWIDHGGNTPLLFATMRGDLASARILVDAGADVNETSPYGASAIVYAAHSGNAELVRYLLEKGADPNADGAGYTALHAAMLRRHVDAATHLLEYGADPNAPLQTTTPTRRASDDFYFHPAWVGTTPFWLAARFSQPRVMRLLLDHGADPHFVHDVNYWMSTAIFTGLNRDEQGATTALMAAVGMGGGRGFAAVDPVDREALSLEAVQIAIDAGIDVNAENAEGETAVDQAAALGYQAVVDLLVANGAPPPEERPRRPQR
ncbi:MAG: hypothetical protein GEU90_14600 [Gemmatimonas sp.]|nr:hypothetical protein [Gemmatimonas sp.]